MEQTLHDKTDRKKKNEKAPNLKSQFRQGRFVPVSWNALKPFCMFKAPVDYKTLQKYN